VLERGRIVETGRHTELLAKRGIYAKLYELQFAEAAGPARDSNIYVTN
jgi:ABC-type multidrug transport system fused ATPase/permease subunit